jgi:hypothetical protein
MDFEPENELERAMLLAASHEAARPDFFRLLMNSDVLVLGEFVDEGQGGLSIDTVTHEGVKYHPIFTSETAMRAFVKNPMPAFAINGHVLMMSTRGANFVINPGSELNKALMPEEVEHWLARRAAEARAGVAIVAPPRHPKKLIQALSVLFTSRTLVRSARLVFAEQAGTEPFPLIGIDSDCDMRTLSKEIFAAAAAAMPGKRIDVLHLNAPGNPHPLKDRLSTVTPFYQRTVAPLN